MTKITQLMPELLIMRDMASKLRCPYCHGENGTHFSNCWGPEGQAAWDLGDKPDIIISRNEVERLIADNDRLREALEYIATNTTHYMHEWVRNYARTALEKI